MHANQARLGFTLVELLVVIAMLALLVGILLPSIGAARGAGYKAKCQANLHSIGQAWEMYLIDNDGRYLRRISAHFNYGGRMTTDRERPLNPYLGIEPSEQVDAEVFRCPVDEGGGNIQPTAYEFHGNSYRANNYIIGGGGAMIHPDDPCPDAQIALNNSMSSIRQDLVARPGRTLLLGDYGWVSSFLWFNNQPMEWHREPCKHNILFADAHVEFIQIRKGIYEAPEYTLLPFDEHREAFRECQEERPCHQ